MTKMMSPQWCHHCDGLGYAAAPCTCAAPRKCGVRGCGADATTGEVTIGGGLRVRCDKHRHTPEKGGHAPLPSARRSRI